MSQPSSSEGPLGIRLLDLTNAAVRDSDDRITLWTGGMEELSGWPRAEALGRVSHSLLKTEFPRPLPEIRADLLRDGHWEGKLTHTRKDGGRVVVASRWVLQLDEQGRPAAVFEVNCDITEAEQRRDEFLALLAHELRNPLAPILTSVELLKRLGLNQAGLAEPRGILERQVRQLTALLDDLLDVSRLTLGKMPIRKEVVAVGDVVSRAFELVRPLIDARGHAFTLSLPARPLRIEADPVRLAQALANLLTNAAKFMAVGGRMSLTVKQEEGDVVFRVRDRGIGIPADQLARVFELFAQAGHGPDRPHDGLGVGLALVKSLVDLHGGSVEAFSEGPGKGSEFVVRVPALPETPRGNGETG